MGLDVARFLLASVTMVFHYTFAGPHSGFIDVEPGPQFLNLGRYGVHAFFAISGFVIMLSISSRTRWQFIKARALRLLPAILVCATITLIVTRTMSDGSLPATSLKGWLRGATLAPMIFSTEGLDWAYWSLTYELRFYLAVALFIPLLRSPRHMLAAAALWLAGSFAACILPELSTVTLWPYSGFFIVGMAIYVWREDPDLQRPAVGLVTMAVPLCLIQLLADSAARAEYTRITMPEAVGIAVAVPLIMVAATLNYRRSDLVARLGAMSYPLYLIHTFVGYVIIHRLMDVGLAHWPAVGTAMTVSLASAWAVSRLEPMIKAWLLYLGSQGASFLDGRRQSAETS